MIVEPPDLALVVPSTGEAVPAPQHGGDIEVARDGLGGTLDAASLGHGHWRPQQRLARHAGPVGTLAADKLGLHDDRAEARSGGAAGDVLTGRAGPDDDHVIAEVGARFVHG